MTVTKQQLLKCLPEYTDQWAVIMNRQYVPDIMEWMVYCHEMFKEHYDKICWAFEKPTVEQTCEALYDFCKENIRYKEETVKSQTVALPAGILTRGYGDCKHYALFCGGVLDALKRTGMPINWAYYFASYNGSSDPYHVFVCVYNNGEELWLDPTPGSTGKEPTLLVKESV